MGAADDSVRQIRAQVAALGRGPWVLAVSGGADSMVLLDAAATVLPICSLAVATFDHGTGAAATQAADLVVSVANSLGVAVVVGRSERAGSHEAEWRNQRWSFLRSIACDAGATVVTAHTADDQVETVFMRALRGAGPRGLAGLYADSGIARPLVATSRRDVRGYAASEAVPYIVDPSNNDRRHLRNRVRLDLLPALEIVHPGFGAELLRLARRAAKWRAQMEALALSFPMVTQSHSVHSFARAPLRVYDIRNLRTLWPALAARAGVVLDWRGTERLASFTIEGATGQKIQLAGRIEVRMSREAITLASGQVG